MRHRVLMFLLLAVFTAAAARAQRLPTTVAPVHYDLTFDVDIAHAKFEGTETIRVHANQATSRIVLNAAEIEFHDVEVTTNGRTGKASVALDDKAETATFTLPGPIAAGGEAEIAIKYTGRLNDKLRGFYLSKAERRNYAVTQFESTDARRAFPCFDEPTFKATFAVTLLVDRGDTAIANGRIVSDVDGPGPGRHTLKFSTSPKMSSYLVAMAVGDFQCLQGSADEIPIRICTTPDKKNLGHIALESAEYILGYYDKYYATKYPFGKLDVVAVPDFAAGAMENTAAIFYRETDLLADSARASLATRKTIAGVLAHEMAHQWFGDLVTMAWWDDIWLNEGFATWMATRPLAAWKPDWHMEVDEALEAQTALNLDALSATRPIHSAVNTPAQIDEAFDAIAYQKGAAVLRMIESYVGPEVFQKGVNAYLAQHAYGNATAQDFWSAIATTSGKPVDRIMPTFVNQPGVPLVSASLSCPADGPRVALAQHRFGDATNEHWQIPVCIQSPSGGAPNCSVLDRPEGTVTPPGAGCPPWVFANAGARGYYRTAYTPELLAAIGPEIQDKLTAPERLSLEEDVWALVRAGRQSVADYFTVGSHYGNESSADVLGMMGAHLRFTHAYLTTNTTRPRFEAFVRSLLGPQWEKLGFATNSSDSEDRRSLRSIIVSILGTIGADSRVIADARAAVDRALSGGAALDPIVESAALGVAAEHGDAKLYDALLRAANEASSPDEHYRYLYATTDFTDPALIDRSLQYTLSKDLRSQDSAIYLAQLFGNPAARKPAWSFLTAHWTELAPKITIFGGDTTVVSSLSGFCDARSRDDIKAFFAAHPLPAAVRTLNQTIERINTCIAISDQQTPVMTEWVNKKG